MSEKFKASIVLSKDPKNRPDIVDDEKAYTFDELFQVSCDRLQKLLMTSEQEIGIGYGRKTPDKVHVVTWDETYTERIAVCGWGSGRIDQTPIPILKYGKKYKVCINCRKHLEAKEIGNE